MIWNQRLAQVRVRNWKPDARKIAYGTGTISQSEIRLN